MNLLILLSVMLVIVAGLCSCVEAALFSVSPIKINSLKDTDKRAVKLLQLRTNINRPIAAIAIINNINNIAGSSLVGQIAAKQLGTWAGAFIALLTLIVILYAEIYPKKIGEKYSIKIALFSTFFIIFITKLLTPLIVFIELMTGKGKEITTEIVKTDEEEIKQLTKLGVEQGEISNQEKDILEGVFRLDKITAKEIMTPRTLLTYFHHNQTLGEIKEELINSSHSRIITIDGHIDNVVGVVYKTELLIALNQGKDEQVLKNFVHSAKFFTENDNADTLLKHFKNTRKHLIIIRDGHQGIAGVITFEDILEVLVGNIIDETDKIPNLNSYAKLTSLLKDFS